MRPVVEVKVQADVAEVDLLHGLLQGARHVRPLQEAAVAQALVGGGVQRHDLALHACQAGGVEADGQQVQVARLHQRLSLLRGQLKLALQPTIVFQGTDSGFV